MKSEEELTREYQHALELVRLETAYNEALAAYRDKGTPAREKKYRDAKAALAAKRQQDRRATGRPEGTGVAAVGENKKG